MSEDVEPMSDDEQQRRRAMVAEHMPQTPFISLLGLKVEKFEPDDVMSDGHDGAAADVATSSAQP